MPPDIQPIPRPEWSPLPFEGCRNVEGKVLLLTLSPCHSSASALRTILDSLICVTIAKFIISTKRIELTVCNQTARAACTYP